MESGRAQEKDFSPYDMITSEGEHIKYEDYVDNLTDKQKESLSKPSKGLNITNSQEKINKDIEEIKERYKNKKFENNASINVVIGSDQRKKVYNSTVSPYSAISFILSEKSNGYLSACTGSLIGYDAILTNAHCVKDYDNNGAYWVETTGGIVAPGTNNTTFYFGFRDIGSYVVPKGWIDSKGTDTRYDYAVIRLSSSFAYPPTLGYTKVSNVFGTIKTAGFPGDLNNIWDPFLDRVDMYESNGWVKNQTNELLFYDADTYNGQSGSDYTK